MEPISLPSRSSRRSTTEGVSFSWWLLFVAVVWSWGVLKYATLFENTFLKLFSLGICAAYFWDVWDKLMLSLGTEHESISEFVCLWRFLIMSGEGSLVYDLASLTLPYTSLLSYDLASGRLVEEVRAFSMV